MSVKDLSYLKEIEQRLLWLAAWTIHSANHLRKKSEDDVKVGGHQASCASMATIMTALYLDALKPEDRISHFPCSSIPGRPTNARKTSEFPRVCWGTELPFAHKRH